MKFLMAFATVLSFSLTLVAAEKSLRIALVQEWTALNPINNQLASNDALLPFLVRKMVARNAAGAVLPDLAKSIPPLKGKTATWVIRENAKWGDGTSVTCADWELGWRIGLNPLVTTNSRQDYQKIQSISWDKAKPKECTAVYVNSDWFYDRDLPDFAPAHLEAAIYEKHKDKAEGYDRNTTYVTNPTHAGLYTGPYVMSEFKIGSHAVLARNPHFYGDKPQIERIMFKHVADTSTLKAHLLSKEIDVISAVGFPPDTAMNLDEEFEAKKLPYQVRFQDSPIFQGLFFNLDNEILKDPVVRQALSLSVDKELIVKAFFRNRLQPANGVIPPTSPAFRKSKTEFSKQKAIELLEKNGWKLNAKSVREKDGKALSFVFKTSAGIKVLELVQQQICDGFKGVGVECVIKNEPPRILLGESVPRGSYDLTMFGAPMPPDSSLTSRFSSKEVPTKENSWTGANSFRLRSPEIDQLLLKFDKEMKVAKRLTIFQEIEKQMKVNYYAIPIYHRREALVIPRNLKGLSDSFDGTTFSFPEKWVLN